MRNVSVLAHFLQFVGSLLHAKMMTTGEEENDADEELNLTKAGLLETKGNDLPDIPLCGCLSVRFYQP